MNKRNKLNAVKLLSGCAKKQTEEKRQPVSKENNLKFSVLLLIIISAAASRLLVAGGHTPLINFTPVGAMALFGGAYFNRLWKSLLFPVITLFISDIIILSLIYNGKFGFMYKSWPFVYISFILITFFGRWIFKEIRIKNLLIAGVISSLTFWLISDFGFWFFGGIDVTTGLPFSKDAPGLLKCYVLALPYLRNFFLGTIFYSALMFGVFEMAKRNFPLLSIKEA